jgi:hypothetical protein
MSLSQRLYDVVEFLIKDSDMIVAFIEFDVKHFLGKEELFEGIFKYAYEEAFEIYIVGLLRQQAIEHLNIRVDEALILIDIPMLKRYNIYNRYCMKEIYL